MNGASTEARDRRSMGAAISTPGVSVMDPDPEHGLIVRDTMCHDRPMFERQVMAGFGGGAATPAP